jgi:manganese/zinc/iron transport system substrate-binding protein
MKNFKYLAILLSLALLLAACGQSTEQESVDLSERPIRVVATIGMIADVAETIGGERVDVTGLMGPGVDPHLYKATEGDVSTLSEADVIFFNGLHLEAKMGEVLEQMGSRTKTLAVTDAVDESALLSPPEFEGAHDPHVWFDVQLWMKATESIRDALIEIDPGSEELYRANAETYLAELEELDAYVQEQTARVPEQQRVLITAHDAFNYFGEAYGFEVRGLQGISTATEAGTGDVQDLATFIAENEIPAIFVESSVPVRNIEAVQAAVQAKGFEVGIGGELFSDAMGDAGTEEGTYTGMVRHNVDTIVNALLGQ